MLRSGVNVSRWFRQATSTDPAILQDYVSDSEMAAMHDMGIKHVRLPVDLRYIMGAGGVMNARFANAVEDAIHRFNQHDIAVVLTFANQDRKQTEGKDEFMSNFGKFWRTAASRFAVNDPEMLYFEVINEPEYVGNEQLWIRYQEALVKEIRAVAPQHTIIVTGPAGGGLAGFHKLRKLPDLNIVYSFHFYEPFLTSQQAALKAQALARETAKSSTQTSRAAPTGNRQPDTYLLPKGYRRSGTGATTPLPPSNAYTTTPPYGDPNWGRYQLWSRVDYPIWWGRENKVPVYCGAFGIPQRSATSDKRSAWYDALRQSFAANKTGWAVWSWDEGYGLYHQHVMGKLEVDRAVAQGLGLNTQALAFEQAK